MDSRQKVVVSNDIRGCAVTRNYKFFSVCIVAVLFQSFFVGSDSYSQEMSALQIAAAIEHGRQELIRNVEKARDILKDDQTFHDLARGLKRLQDPNLSNDMRQRIQRGNRTLQVRLLVRPDIKRNETASAIIRNIKKISASYDGTQIEWLKGHSFPIPKGTVPDWAQMCILSDISDTMKETSGPEMLKWWNMDSDYFRKHVKDYQRSGILPQGFERMIRVAAGESTISHKDLEIVQKFLRRNNLLSEDIEYILNEHETLTSEIVYRIFNHAQETVRELNEIARLMRKGK